MLPQSETPSHSDCRWQNSMQDCQGKTGDYTKVKCVLVGDGAVGKTSLVISYTTNGFPTEYVPTAYDNYNVLVTVNKEPIQLQLCDTAGQDDFDLLRPLCYPNTDVFVLCFSIVSPTSFSNVTEKWLPEIRRSCPVAPIVLVGTQSDLRNDVKVLIELSQYGDRPVSEADGKSKARRIGAVTYVECSSLTQHNLKQVFDVAVMAALVKRSPVKKNSKTDGKKTGINGIASSPQCARRNSDRRQPDTVRRWWKRPFCCT